VYVLMNDDDNLQYNNVDIGFLVWREKENVCMN